MASFLHRPQRHADWSVEDCALYAARKEFELLKLLSTDKRALATARRLGLFQAAGHPHAPSPSPTAAALGGDSPGDSVGADDASAKPRGSRSQRRPACNASAPTLATVHAQHALSHPPANAPPGARAQAEEAARPPLLRREQQQQNARQRRSAARSAQRHAERQRPLRVAVLACSFMLKLQRRARLARSLAELDCLDGGAAFKRGRESPPSDDSSSVSGSSSSSSMHLLLDGSRTSPRKPSHPMKRVVGAARAMVVHSGLLLQ